MTAGLPGTGIGGIFYMLLAAYMPICEFFKTLRGESSLKRWAGVTRQVAFIAGILTAMWSEVWVLNRTLLWFGQHYHLAFLTNAGKPLFIQTGKMAYASGLASLISLTFVMAVVCVLRAVVSRSQNPAIDSSLAQSAQLLPQAN